MCPAPITDTFGVRIAARYSNSEGAFKNTAAQDSVDALGRAPPRYSSRRGRSASFGARLTLNWDVTDNFNMELKTGATWMEDGGPNADCKVDGRSDLSTLPVEVVRANYRYAGDM